MEVGNGAAGHGEEVGAYPGGACPVLLNAWLRGTVCVVCVLRQEHGRICGPKVAGAEAVIVLSFGFCD